MNKLVETDRLFITEMTADMAMDVHKNSLDEDIRRFVPMRFLKHRKMQRKL
jgi:ribosomal-protein-alanine N-acetyltransferase